MSSPDLCVGVLVHDGRYDVATMDAAGIPVTHAFPSSALAREALRIFLAGQARHIRLAVAGDAAIACALSVGPSAHCDVVIVALGVADHAPDLARYVARVP